MNEARKVTGLLIQLRRLEAMEHAADMRCAIWAVGGFLVGATVVAVAVLAHCNGWL